MKLKCGVYTWFCVWAAAGLWATELPLVRTERETRFGDERLQVVFDANGVLAGIRAEGRSALIADAERGLPFDIQEDQVWASRRRAKLELKEVTRIDDTAVRSRIVWGPWQVDACVRLHPAKGMVQRRFMLEWLDEKPNKLRFFWVQSGKLAVTNDHGGYLVPVRFPRLDRTKADFKPGAKDYAWRSPSPVLGDDGAGRRVSWIMDELVPHADGGAHEIDQRTDGFGVVTSFNCKGHVRKGQPQTIGDDWICLGTGSREDALTAMGDWFRTVGQVPPTDRPKWLKGLTLYSLHPGGTIGSNCRDWGGFGPSTVALDHIHALGCNAVWLMPIEDASIYCPRDYYKLQAGIGTPADYRAFTARAHALGMRVWQDCVPHGGRSEFPRAKEHPEWLAYDEQGKPLDYWCFDFNWPSWIDYMAKVVDWYTREYTLDGFRIDAVCGSHIPNWSEKIPYGRASFAQSQGGLAMQRALRKALKGVNPDGANLAEAGESIHGATSDAVYDFSLCYEVLHAFAQRSPAEGVPLLRRWLHEQSLAEIPDLVRMRHLESHDSLRAALWHGTAPTRAMMALIAWIPGIPLVYQEMEDGSFDAFREIFRVRAENPILTEGDVDYLSPTVPSGVFACTRTLGKQVCVPVVNFNSHVVKGCARVGDRDVSFELPAFGYTVLGLSPRSEVGKSGEAASPLTCHPTLDSPRLFFPGGKPVTAPYRLEAVTNVDRSVTWRVVSFAGVDPAKTELVFRFAKAKSWFARTAEGDFSSPYRVRHPSFDGTVGPIYHHPQGGNCVWDSRLHPFGFTGDHAAVGAVVGATAWTFVCTNNLIRMRRARVLDRVGDDHAVHVAFGALDESARFTLTPSVAGSSLLRDVDPAGTGDPRLRVVAGGWMFDNGRIRLFIRRNGALNGFWRKDKTGTWVSVIRSAATYTDVGYGKSYTDGQLVSKFYTQVHDVETYMDFCALRAPVGRGEGLERLILSFEGALRHQQRFAKMRTPINFRTVYELTDGESFGLTQQVQTTSEPKDGIGFLAWMANVNGITGAEFVDTTGFSRRAASKRPYGRILETRADESAAPVVSASLTLSGGERLRIVFDQDASDSPTNLFCDGDNFFFAWQDCRKGGDFHPWVWRGFSARIGW